MDHLSIGVCGLNTIGDENSLTLFRLIVSLPNQSIPNPSAGKLGVGDLSIMNLVYYGYLAY